ncbi:MAG: hypothetical protein QN163_04090 [Armatimonadota bacterium]|nr:hypothetical protein [Armatimonadota bacterium]MDR5697548.1 hypothetical protein [Armatimonadota bacterium]
MTAAIPFMAAAVLLLPLLGAGVAWIGGRVAAGDHRAYPVLAVNHLATLAWGTLVAMGALHQMFPAVLGVSAKPGRGALVQFAITTTGIAVLVAGFLARRTLWIAVGGTVTWVGITVFLWQVLRRVPQRRRWPLPATGVVVSLVYLWLAATWGAMMGWNWIRMFWPALLTHAGIGVHAVLGLVGWFCQLIISVSYYLLPRFTGNRQIGDGRLAAILWATNVGIALLVAAAFSALGSLARAGTLALSVAGALYAADLRSFVRGGTDRRPDLTNRHWWAITTMMALQTVVAAGWAVGWVPVEGRRAAVAAAVWVLFGFVTPAILGQLYKVTPFLIWHYRYAKGMSAAEVPRLQAPYHPTEGVLAFWLTTAAAALFPIAVLLQQPIAGTVAGALLLTGTLVFAYLMAASWIGAAVRTNLDGAAGRV